MYLSDRAGNNLQRTKSQNMTHVNQTSSSAPFKYFECILYQSRWKTNQKKIFKDAST